MTAFRHPERPRHAHAHAHAPRDRGADGGAPELNGRLVAEALAGLLRSEQRTLPCALFYDKRGSELFDRICELPEYYLTRCERWILDRHGEEVAAAIGRGAMLIELGSGSSAKTRLLLDRARELAAYVPIDISREHLLDAARAIARDYPDIEVLPLNADYTERICLPQPQRRVQRRVVLFPGSTIGNLDPAEAEQFLWRMGALVGPCGALLIGVDVNEDETTLLPAYDDAQGVTAAFNRNALVRLNREAGADFDPDQLEHRVVYSRELRRIEMHLVSRKDQVVRLAGHAIALRAGESIRTELSHKYGLDGFRGLAARAGLEAARIWTDPDRLYALFLLTRVQGPRPRTPAPAPP